MKWKEVKPLVAKRLQSANLFDEEVILIDGFVHAQVSDHLGSAPMVGSNVPMIMLVGKESSRVYFISYLAFMNK